jgi:folylpolyglutamate synthase/dihydropteroate synthase
MRLPGRLERMPSATAPEVWIDGAHNGDKVAALAREIARFSPGEPLPVIVLGVLDAKDPASIVSGLRDVASSMVLTEPVVVGREALKATRLRDVVLASGFGGAVQVEPQPDSAVQCAQALARSQGTAVLVAGSMYLAGHVRSRWYRDEEIVVQRTPWRRRL